MLLLLLTLSLCPSLQHDSRKAENFDKVFTHCKVRMTPTDSLIIMNIDDEAFYQFSFVNPYFNPIPWDFASRMYMCGPLVGLRHKFTLHPPKSLDFVGMIVHIVCVFSVYQLYRYLISVIKEVDFSSFEWNKPLWCINNCLCHFKTHSAHHCWFCFVLIRVAYSVLEFWMLNVSVF